MPHIKPHEAFKVRSGSPWTHVLEVECVRLWNAGGSALEISKALGNGLTRNSVIGKLHRLKRQGVTMRETSPADNAEGGKINSRAAKRREPHRTIPKQAKARSEPLPPLPVSVESVSPRSWMEREFGQCAYLIDAKMACCNPVKGDEGMSSRYCAGHMAVMVDEVKTKKMGLRSQSWRENLAVSATRKERLDQYRHVNGPRRVPSVVTPWDEGRAA